ncbi:hypothetical protein H920_11762 [Fukomys damarensis]|uniref:Uncharacterized protein n=1 Tax=Fukomys damarensis TaxID=885580 RepID=A0A091D717_FUKDA|nr:hypothetical protein H920_11762 [Fukomys damarensis]
MKFPSLAGNLLISMDQLLPAGRLLWRAGLPSLGFLALLREAVTHSAVQARAARAGREASAQGGRRKDAQVIMGQCSIRVCTLVTKTPTLGATVAFFSKDIRSMYHEAVGVPTLENPVITVPATLTLIHLQGQAGLVLHSKLSPPTHLSSGRSLLGPGEDCCCPGSWLPDLVFWGAN